MPKAKLSLAGPQPPQASKREPLLSNPSRPVGYRGCITLVGSLLLLGPSEKSRSSNLEVSITMLGAREAGVFIPCGLMAVSYNVSALENARKRWLPAGTGRRGPLPTLQRRGFRSKATAPSALPLDREYGRV